jgi:hypothetical protein
MAEALLAAIISKRDAEIRIAEIMLTALPFGLNLLE